MSGAEDVRHEFCSPEWVRAFGEVFGRAVTESEDRYPGLTFSMAEVYEDAPDQIARGAARVGWNCVVEDGKLVRFAAGDPADVGYRMVGDYAALIEVARFELGGDPARKQAYDALVGALVAAGKLRTEGTHPRLPRPFGRVHDAVARFTA